MNWGVKAHKTKLVDSNNISKGKLENIYCHN